MRGFVVMLDFHILHKISYQMVPKWFLLQFVQGKPHFGSRLPWLYALRQYKATGVHVRSWLM